MNVCSQNKKWNKKAELIRFSSLPILKISTLRCANSVYLWYHTFFSITIDQFLLKNWLTSPSMQTLQVLCSFNRAFSVSRSPSAMGSAGVCSLDSAAAGASVEASETSLGSTGSGALMSAIEDDICGDVVAALLRFRFTLEGREANVSCKKILV